MPRLLKTCPDKTCEFCGTHFNRRRFGTRLEDYGRFQTRRFCSISCAESKHSPTDRGTFCKRAQAFKQASCDLCGSKQSLDVHHEDGDIANNTAENTRTLCHSCHMKLHWKLRKRGIVFGSHKRPYPHVASPDSKPSETPSSRKSHTKSVKE
jgi:hypothetical protein